MRPTRLPSRRARREKRVRSCRIRARDRPLALGCSMRIVTVNVNGIRSAARRGFARWLARIEPWDVVCLQEIKAHVDDVPRALAAPRKSHASFHTANKRGYSGVALYAKRPASVQVGFGSVEFDAEGRYVEADFGHLSIISVYLPSGSSSPDSDFWPSFFHTCCVFAMRAAKSSSVATGTLRTSPSISRTGAAIRRIP